jgi:hypothetical protein
VSAFVYLYCLTDKQIELDGLSAMESGKPLQLAGAGPLWAIWSEVGDDFAEANLNTRVRDLDWLSPRAVRHHEVVDAIYALSKPVLPLSFGTIFASPESLAKRLTAELADLQTRLDQLRGRDEWNLKLIRDRVVFAEQLRQVSPTLESSHAELAEKPPGTRFLLEKKLKNLQAQEEKRVSAAIRAEVHDALAALAVESHRDQLTPPAPADASRLELRAAYLVDESSIDALQRAVSRLASKYGPLGYTAELTGPWPPFTFARNVQETLV